MCVHQDERNNTWGCALYFCIWKCYMVYCPNDDWNIQSNIGKLFSELTLVTDKLLGRSQLRATLKLFPCYSRAVSSMISYNTMWCYKHGDQKLENSTCVVLSRLLFLRTSGKCTFILETHCLYLSSQFWIITLSTFSVPHNSSLRYSSYLMYNLTERSTFLVEFKK